MPGGKPAVNCSRGCRVAGNYANRAPAIIRFREKERPGYEWGPRWGACGSGSPAFAWGQTPFVSGEEIVSVRGIKANIVPGKNRGKFKASPSDFFSFCDSKHPKVPNSTTFRAKNASFASCDRTTGCDPKNSHLTDACGELRRDACAERSADHASMQMIRRARQNALDQSALGIQDGAIHRIVCRAR